MMLEILVNAESDELVSIFPVTYLLGAYYALNCSSWNVFTKEV